MVHYAYPKALRLRKTAEFRKVYDFGQKQVGRHIVLWVRPNELGHFRAGAVASKKVGNAVTRNRAKRRIRELIRGHQHQFSPGQDLVPVSRHSVPRVGWDLLLKDFEHVCRKAGVFKLECEEPRS